jgi:hypothetical protein
MFTITGNSVGQETRPSMAAMVIHLYDVYQGWNITNGFSTHWAAWLSCLGPFLSKDPLHSTLSTSTSDAGHFTWTLSAPGSLKTEAAIFSEDSSLELMWSCFHHIPWLKRVTGWAQTQCGRELHKKYKYSMVWCIGSHLRRLVTPPRKWHCLVRDYFLKKIQVNRYGLYTICTLPKAYILKGWSLAGDAILGGAGNFGR